MSAATTTPHTPWPTVKLGDVCEVARGGSPRPIKSYITQAVDGLNWIKIGDVSPNGKYIEKTAEKIKPSGLNKTRQVAIGDFLLSNSMSFGRPYILKIDGCIHDGWLVLRGFRDVLEENFFYYLLRTEYVHSQFELYASGSTVRNLNTKSVESVLIPLPPLDVQREIVAKVEAGLKEADGLVAHFKRLAALADDTFKAELDETFSTLNAPSVKLGEQGSAEDLYQQIQAKKAELIKAGKLKKEKPLPPISSKDIPFEIPSTWKWVRLGDIVDVRDGTHDTPKYVPNGVPLVTSKNLVNGAIDFTTAKQISYADAATINIRSSVDDGDILFAMIGTIGNPVLVRKDREFSIKNMAVFKPIDGCSFRMEYLMQFLVKAQADMRKVTNASVQTFVSLSFLRCYLFPLPPLDIQREIVGKLEAVKARCEQLKGWAERGLKAAEALRKAVLAEAFEQ